MSRFLQKTFGPLRLACLTVVLWSTPAFPCSLAPHLPVAPAPNEHIFTGKIIGYSGPIQPKDTNNPAWGIRVRVTGKVQLSPPPQEEYDVYFFPIDPACRHDGLPKEKVQSLYQVGEEVQIVAVPPRKESMEKSDHLILFVSPALDSQSHFARPSKATLTPDGQFRYKQSQFYETGSMRQALWEDSTEPMVFSFEWRKDLIRLRNAKDDQERVPIVKRMIGFPWYHKWEWFLRELCPQLINKNVSEPTVRATLLGDCARLLQREEVIHAVAYTRANKLDSKLPDTPFLYWILRLGEPNPHLAWEMRNCDTRAKSPERAISDIPVCVDVRSTLSDNRAVIVYLKVDTSPQKYHLSWHTTVDKVDFGEEGTQRSLNALHELLNFLRFLDCDESVFRKLHPSFRKSLCH